MRLLSITDSANLYFLCFVSGTVSAWANDEGPDDRVEMGSDECDERGRGQSDTVLEFRTALRRKSKASQRTFRGA